MNKIELVKGDITNITVQAIVNPANTSLLGGSGLDGLIHRKGGKRILEECQKIRNKQGGCKVSEAVITSAGNLPADYIIHAVGPVWSGGFKNEETLLSLTYNNILNLAVTYKIKTISLPSISTGIYRFPKDKAAQIAIKTVVDFLKKNKTIDKILFVCYDEIDFNIYAGIINKQSS